MAVHSGRTLREQTVLAAVTTEPVSTSDLYERVGYPALMRAGLIAYREFRATLVGLEETRQVVSGTDDDGATTWRLAPG
jgi:hypothetical protein